MTGTKGIVDSSGSVLCSNAHGFASAARDAGAFRPHAASDTIRTTQGSSTLFASWLHNNPPGKSQGDEKSFSVTLFMFSLWQIWRNTKFAHFPNQAFHRVGCAFPHSTNIAVSPRLLPSALLGFE